MQCAPPILVGEIEEDPKYRGLTKCMWDDYRSGVWSDESLMGIIDSLSAVLAEPSVRPRAMASCLSIRLAQLVHWPTYEEEVSWLRNWILERVAAG